MDFIQKARFKRDYQLTAPSPHRIMTAWLLEPTQGEKRSVAKERIVECIKNKSICLDLQGLGLTALPDIFNLSELAHLQTIKLSGNVLSKQCIRSLQSESKLDVLVTVRQTRFQSKVSCWLVPTRAEFIKANLATQLWFNQGNFSAFKRETKEELRNHILSARSRGEDVTVRQAMTALYQPTAPRFKIDFQSDQPRLELVIKMRRNMQL